MTTGVLIMLTTFASMTGNYVPDNFIDKNIKKIIYITDMVEKQLKWSCNILWPLNSKDNRLLSLWVRCYEKIDKRNSTYYVWRIVMDLKTYSFIRIRDKKTLYNDEMK